MRNRRQRTVGKMPARRTQAPPDVRQSGERFRLLVESVIDYAILMLDPEGRVVSWNAGAERLKGYRASEIIGQHFSRFYPPEDVERHKPEYELEKAAADGRLEDEGWRVRKDGSIFWANVVITALRDESGTLHGFGKVTRDLTERKRAEEEIRQLNDDLRRRTEELTSTNADLEAFSYSVAHDLRAPLRQVLGFSKILTEDYGPQLDPGARRCLDRVQSGAQQMGRLVDDLLNLAKVGRQPLSREITSLNVVLDAALQELAPECSGRSIEWHIRDLFSTQCDPGLMKQVFVNLLSNALKYTRPRDPAVVEVGQTTGKDEPVVFIRDNGVGFDMQHAGKLFGVFQRLHKARDFEGTGVGLATVERIIRKHGGRVWAEAEPDRGAMFCFTVGPATR